MDPTNPKHLFNYAKELSEWAASRHPYFCHFCDKWVEGVFSTDYSGHEYRGCPVHYDQRALIRYSGSN